MTEKEINIKFHEYSSIDELPKQDQELALAAIEAMRGSYAPYSHFNVGAAVRLSNGEIVKGANQENAAFPSGLCAERTAMFYAGATYPDKSMVSIAIAGGVMGRLAKAPATPCGACRQVLSELFPKDAPVYLGNLRGDEKITTVAELLPFAFDGGDL